MVEEITVMGDSYDRAGILLEVLFEPVDTLGIEVVGRLVKKQHIGLLEQQTAQSHTATLAARQCRHLLVVRRTLECIHGAFELRIDVPRIGSVDFVLEFGLTGYELVHLVGVVEHIGVSESLVDLLKLSKQVHDWLHAFAHHLYDRLVGVEFGFLFKIPYRIARREHHLALIALVYAGYYLEQCRLT